MSDPSEKPALSATYRLQFVDDGLNLNDGAALVPYLDLLGISHAYSSPIFEFKHGVGHTYGQVDANKVDSTLGGREKLEHFSKTLKAHGMGLVLDIVPNHMRASYMNPWWRDVLENGPDSDYADFFEIDWQAGKGKVMIPILGGQFGEIFNRGELQLKQDTESGVITLDYYSHKFPIKDSAKILEKAGGDVEGYWNALENRAALRDIIGEQNYRLADWQRGYGAMNYRRFFDINELVGLMQEKPKVFEAAHELVLDLIKKDLVQGLRVDHIDGLRQVKKYLDDLRAKVGPDVPIWVEKILEGEERLPEDFPVQGTTGYEFLNQAMGLYVDPRGEKTLTDFYKSFTGETRSFEEVHQQCKSIILDHTFSSEMDSIRDALVELAEQNPDTQDFTQHHMKHGLHRVIKHFDVYRTYDGIGPLSAQDQAVIARAVDGAKTKEAHLLDPRATDFIGKVLSGKLREEPGYDPNLINHIVCKTQQLTGPTMAKSKEDTAFYRWFRLVALNEVGGDPAKFGTSPAEFHAENQWRAQHAPQTMNTTQTHDTKRGEDTRLRIAVLSELAKDWVSHVEHWSALNDTLWDELSEQDKGTHPDRNDEYLLYQMLVGTFPTDIESPDDPKLKDFAEKTKEYISKAIQEAKVRTTWTAKNDKARAYEKGFATFIDKILDPADDGNRAFLNSMIAFKQRISFVAAAYSLGQAALKILSPGLPDMYQGTEFWDLSRVDPDNRRAVDFNARANLLKGWQEKPADIAALSRDWEDGHIKLFTQQRLLWLRKSNPELFADDNYTPLASDADGKDDKFTAFMRRQGADAVIVAAPRQIADAVDARPGQPLKLSDSFRKAAQIHVPDLKPGTELTDIFTGRTTLVRPDGTVSLADMDMPVVVLRTGSVRDNNPLKLAA